jgi:hypothetical protein
MRSAIGNFIQIYAYVKIERGCYFQRSYLVNYIYAQSSGYSNIEIIVVSEIS